MYKSSATASRGFCGTCGSVLTFNDEKTQDLVEVNLGTLDEDVLCGERDEKNAWEDEHGRHAPRIGGWGKLLGAPRYHIFCENEIPGVTDGFEGKKYLQDQKGGKVFKGKVADLQKA